MMRQIAWLILILPLGVSHLWGQSVTLDEKLETLTSSEVLTTADLHRAADHQPFLIDRWHLMATVGYEVTTYPEGKGEPSYPILDAALWNRHSALDLELLGHIHRQREAFSRYRIGDTRQVLTLVPATTLIQYLNDIRVLTQPRSGQ